MRYLLILVLALFLHACGPQGSEAPRASLSGAEIWQPVDGGGLLHLKSGIVLPEEAGVYERGNVVEYEPDGNDVSVTYKHRDKKKFGEVTFYISKYPGVEAQPYFNVSLGHIQQRFPKHELILDGEYKSQSHSDFNGPIAVFEGNMGKHYARSGLWVKEKVGWLLKARYSYEYEGEKGMPVSIQQLAPLISEAINNAEKTGKNEVTIEMNGDAITDLLIGKNSEGIYSDMLPSFDVITSMDISNIHE